MYKKIHFISKMSRGQELYTAALILTEGRRKEHNVEEVTPEPLKEWRPVIRINEKVIRRR